MSVTATTGWSLLWKRTVFSVRYELQCTVYCIVFIDSRFQTTLLTPVPKVVNAGWTEQFRIFAQIIRAQVWGAVLFSEMPVTMECCYVLLCARPPVPAQVTCNIHRGVASCDVTRIWLHTLSRQSFPTWKILDTQKQRQEWGVFKQ